MHGTDATTTAALPTDANTASTSSSTQISLNVRTLDHKTYSVSILSDASVPELKELIAGETGVVIGRQRLIFRGKVLKNDQKISAYSLEDGHTLHLVVRAEPETTERTEGTASTAPPAPLPLPLPGPQPTPQRRNNDEPDPTIGQAGNHVVMGATIAVPEGSDVNMPFLTSMIANMIASVQGSVAAGNVEQGGEPRGSSTTARSSAPGGRPARVRRSRRAYRMNPTSASTASTGTTSGTTLQGNGSMFPSLSARIQGTYESLRSNLNNPDFAIDGVNLRRLETAEATNNTMNAAFLQRHFEQLDELFRQWNPRMQLLPIALQELQDLANNPSDQRPLVHSAMQAVDALQLLSEYIDLLSRYARNLVQRSSRTIPRATVRLNERGGLRATFSSPISIPIRISARDLGAFTTTTGGQTATSSSNQSATAASIAATSTTTSANPSSTAAPATNATNDDGNRSNRSGNPLYSLLERMNESFRGVTSLVSGGSSLSSDGNTSSNATATTSSASNTTNPPPAGSSAARASEAESSLASPSIRPLFTGLGAPVSMVFPVPLGDMTIASSTWNFAEFMNRLVSDLSASTMYAVTQGDPVSVHQVMAQTGFGVLSGLDLPMVTRSSIRSWSNTLVGELRQQLRANGIPSTIAEHLPQGGANSFVDEFFRPIESFMPDLVNLLIRATTITRTQLFGVNSTAFLLGMARAFVAHMRTYLFNSQERLVRVLEALLVMFGLDERMASYLVTCLLNWADTNEISTSEASEQPEVGQRRRREESEDTSSSSSAAAAKRRRQ